jgi:uncharacterized protein (UPF0333 family)
MITQDSSKDRQCNIILKKKSQLSIEYVLIMGFSLLMLMPLMTIFIYNNNSFNEDVAIRECGKALSSIITTSETVQYLGEPTQKTIRVYLPNNIINTTFNNRQASITLLLNGKAQEIIKSSNINMTGNITIHQGIHTLRIRAINNTVMITEE